MSTILVIDDDASMRVTTCATLLAAGHLVVEADGPQTGLERIRERVPDLVLCDQDLGEVTGLDMLSRLRQTPSSATLPFVLCTSSHDDSIMRRGMDLGADDFLQKPFTPHALLAAVAARLERQDHLRQQARAATEESEARFQAIARIMPDALVMFDERGVVVLWNPAAARIFGYVEAEAIGESIYDLIVPLESRHLYQRAILRRWGREPAPTRRLDGQARHRDGTLFEAELFLCDVTIDQRIHCVIIARDVSRERQVQDTLVRKRILFRTLIDALPDCVAVKDTQGRRTLANKAEVRFAGGSGEEDLLGQTDLDLFPEETAARSHADDMRVIACGETVERQELTTNHFGEQRWMESTKLPLYDPGGQIIGLVTIGHDITKRLRVEERLRELSKAVEQSPASVVITDTTGRIEYVNPKFCALTGYQLEEVIGRNPRILKSGETSVESYRELWSCLTKGREWRCEFHNRKKTGELFWESAVLSPIKDERGRITHYLAVKEDITARKEAELERRKMEMHLRQAQKLESIGQLAAGIAHEINTPMQYIGDNTRFLQDAFRELFAVVGAFRNLQQQGANGPGAMQALQAAVESADVDYLAQEIPRAIEQSLLGADRVSKIVRAMKEFSHPGTDQKSAVDLNHAIESTVTVARNEWKYVADVELDFDQELPLVPCLPGEFNQVILNLIINAAHAIAEANSGGTGAKGRITIRTHLLEKAVEVRVEDTGTGIPPAVRDRIFDPFFTTKPVGKGSGQGLAIARSVIVDKHNGSLSFETEMGKGTTFIARLPLTSDEKPMEPASS